MAVFSPWLIGSHNEWQANRMKVGKRFFFEKKKQKTFVSAF